MNWIILFAAGLLEIVWAVGLKYTQGFTRPLPTVATVVAMTVSILLLGIAVRHLPIGTAYAVWTGIGTLGTFVVGIVVLGEPATTARMISALLIVAGIVGLKFTA